MYLLCNYFTSPSGQPTFNVLSHSLSSGEHVPFFPPSFRQLSPTGFPSWSYVPLSLLPALEVCEEPLPKLRQPLPLFWSKISHGSQLHSENKSMA